MYHHYNKSREARGLSSQVVDKRVSFPKVILSKRKKICKEKAKQAASVPKEMSQVLLERNLEAALAEGTNKIYRRWWSKFSQFCEQRGEVPQRAHPHLVGRFLSKQGEASKGLGGIDQARAAIRWGILMARPSSSSPTDSPLIQGVIKGMKRRFFKPVDKKAPFSRGNLRTFLKEILGQKNKSDEIELKDWRLAAELSLMYLTFSRFEEAKELTIGQVVEDGPDLVVTFKKGKQYQFGESRTSVMAGAPEIDNLDPVSVVKSYMALLVEKVGRNPDQFLFPVLTGKSAWRKPASYSVVRSQFKFWMRRAGLSEEVAFIIYDDAAWFNMLEVIFRFSFIFVEDDLSIF